MNLLELWRTWRLYEEVKNMNLDSKALIKLLVCALLAAGSVAGSQYLAGDPVNAAASVSAAVAAVVAYLQKQPHKP